LTSKSHNRYFSFQYTGIVTTGITVSVLYGNEGKKIQHLIDEDIKQLAPFLVLIEVFVTSIYFFGCCGAFRNSYRMLKMVSGGWENCKYIVELM
jgi:hypothetical protein